MKTLLTILMLIPFVGLGQQTIIPDSLFEQRLINLGYDNIHDGQVATANINTIDSILFFGNISNFTGIEDFTALEVLMLFSSNNPGISILDVSSNFLLRKLKIQSCNIDTNLILNTNNNINLTHLTLNYNIKNLNLVNNTNLIYLEFYGAIGFNSLDLTNNTLLETVICQTSNMDSLNLSQNTLLTHIDVEDSNLKNLNISNGNNTNLTTFNASNNLQLYCIQVDDVNYANTNLQNGINTNISSFSNNCGNEIYGCMDSTVFNYNPNATIATPINCMYPYSQWGPQAKSTFDINGIETEVGPAAFFFDYNNGPSYEVPKGLDKHTLFAHEFWIGGIDDGGQLRLAAQTYRQSGCDFYAGPCSDSVYHSDTITQYWDRTWKIDKTEIDNHIANYNSGTYIMPEAIENWPAHGDVSFGQAPNLAPFIDSDNDGVYHPQNGDYPDIKGDQAIYIIRNDIGNDHSESGGEKIGVEQHIMFYGFRCDNYPQLNNTLFVEMTIHNRRNHNLNDAYIGTWTDMDLGLYLDDYVGSNVDLDLGYTYNGDNDDEGPSGYGLNPPAQGLVYLNKTMDKFVYYNNHNSLPNGYPQNAADYYNYLRGVWQDNVPMTFGGDGHGSGMGATTNQCNYMFPDNTDPNFITPWTEITAGNVPADRRSVMSNGPFTLPAGASYTLEYAFVFAWDSTNTNGGSVPLLFNYTQNIQDFYDGNLSYSCVNINAVNEELPIHKGKLLKIVDVLGREVLPTSNTPLFYIYEGGAVEKKIIIE
jgi:hypothetical protein